MEIILTYSKNEKAKIKTIGNTLNLLTLFVSVGKYLAERISAEKGISLKAAESIVVDCVKDGMKTIN